MKKQTGPRSVLLVLLLIVGLATPGIVFAQQPQPKPQAAAAAPKPEEVKKPEGPKPGEDKTFEEVVKDMEVKKGLFTFYYKADENRLLMEILPDQLEKIFLFAGTLDQASGERGIYAAQVGADFPVYFRRIGKSVQILQKNTTFTAKKDTPAARATARSFADSILGSAKTLSKPHPERKSILIDASELFVSDMPGFAPELNQLYQPSNYRFDKNNSALGPVKTFPESVLLEVWLHYATDNPRATSLTLPDARSVPIVVKYELSWLPESKGFQPRAADDRVGYFLAVQQDFTSDRPSSPYVRYITRWHVEKSDPTAPLSPAKQPIVFWLENTIPVEYREWFREGVLLWNKAFERVGIKDVLVVKQQPDDADWDPADTRYNTIRWFAGVDAAFAIGPSRANPFTGQIYDADIGFSEGIVRGARRFGEEFAGAAALEVEPRPLLPLNAGWLRNLRAQCSYASGLAHQAAFGMDALEARNMLTPEMEERLMREYIVEVTAHEVGHTLGLRHNFRASTILKLDDLHDISKTEQYSQSSSVMDYNPIVLAPKGTQQGYFLPPTLGPYDYWAIEYGYKPIEGDQKAALNQIAGRVAEPMLPYSTDEDAIGTFSPLSIDPRANQYDQSDDPIAYFRQRIGLVHDVWNSMETKLARPGEGYQVMRRALGRGMAEYNRALLTSSKYVGGIYHYRDHVGDPNARPPYVPVSTARQREALEFLRTYAFSEKAFQLPASTLNKLAVERLPGVDWIGYFLMQRLDYPWHDQVLTLQRNVLNRLYHPVTLLRIQDNELRFGPNEKPFAMVDLFTALSTSIWSELESGAPRVSSLRRNLQREHAKQLIRLLMRPAAPPSGPPPVGRVLPMPPTPRPPEDATTLARASLASIQARIRRALPKLADSTTRAHLQETDDRITAALRAQMQKTVE